MTTTFKSARLQTSQKILLVLTLAAALLLAAGFLNMLHPALDSIGHFRLHLAAFLVLSALFLGLGSWRVTGCIAALFGAWVITANFGGQVVAAAGLVFANPKPNLAATGPYRLMQLNVRFDNPEPAAVLSMIRGLHPDIVALEEINGEWAEKLASLDDVYPFRIICNTGLDDGVAILARWKFDKARPPNCFEQRLLATATVDLDGQSIDVAAAHLLWPWPFGQSRQIDHLAAPLGQLSSNAILAGDFNATPWSAALKRIVEEGKLTLIASIGPTWLPYDLPASWRFAGLPIDHVLYKGKIVVHSVRKIAAPGSDHVALIVEFTP